MASLKLEHIYKVYPNGTKAVNDFTMDIKDKEFIVFVGPSGCGKSTTLRMIAGLEEISSGELYIGDQIVNDMEPKDRDIAMVFQNYALYPHMTVYENMAFGLQLRHMPRNEIHERVIWAAKVLGLTEYLDRKPKAMSGGQRQRVSLGRAILRNPKVMLLDEPLSNLDAKLRSQMRSEISKLHQNLKTTFIYVTHDQVEAMTLGTRVVVMKLGRIQQIDAPKNLYDYPINKFVAGFIGTPQMNFFDVKLKRDNDIINISFDLVKKAHLTIKLERLLKVQKQYFDGEHPVTLGIRCENLSISENKDDLNVIPMRINHFEELGNETLVYGDLDLSDSLIIDSPTKVIVKTNARNNLKVGEVVNVKFDISKAHFFDSETEMSISPRLPKVNVFACEIKENKLHVLAHDVDFNTGLENGFVGEMIVPIEAVRLDRKHGLKASVEKIETIDDKHLAYLRINQHLFFALVNDKVKEGDEVIVTLDFEKVAFYKGKECVKQPIRETDSFASYFTNYETVKHNAGEKPEYAKEIEKRVLEAEKPIKEKLEKLEVEFANTKEKLSEVDYKSLYKPAQQLLKAKQKWLKEKSCQIVSEFKKEYENASDKDSVLASYTKKLNALMETYEKGIDEEVISLLIRSLKEKEAKKMKELYETALKELKEVFKKDVEAQKAIYEFALTRFAHSHKKAVLKAEFKQATKKAIDQVNKVFAKRKMDENKDYALSMKLNKDKTTRAARKADHEVFKETFPAEKLGELTSAKQRLQQDFDTNMSALSSEYSRAKYSLKSELKDFNKLNNYYRNPLAVETRKYNKEVNDLNDKLDFEKKHASLLFFMTVNDIAYMLPNNISSKIIQGLGSRVFTKKYRIEVPHNAYKISQEGSLSGQVIELVDYIDNKYYKVQFTDNEGVQRELYLLSRKELPIGSEVKFDIDFEKVEIYENSLNIRLV